MNETDFKALIQVALDIQGSKNEINQQIKQLQKNVEIETGIKVDKSTIQQAFKQISNSSKPKIEVDLSLKKDNLTSNLDSFLSKNTKFMQSTKTQAKDLQIEFERLRLKIADAGDGKELSGLSKELGTLKNKVQIAGLTGIGFGDTLKQNLGAFSNWFAIGGAVAGAVRSIREAVVELKEIDTILTEISKTSERTTESIKKLGETSFDSASKFGRKASDYLLGIQEMSRAGFGEGQSEELSDLSIMAQSAGDMTAELANKYIIATDAAYKLNGETSKLNAILDGQNYITNKNALEMSDLAEATKVVSSQAASSGVEIDKLSAAVGTMIAVTQQGGDTAARAFKAILMNIQQVSGTVDEETGEIINEDDLRKYEKAANDLGVALKEVKDGYVSLRDPMEVLKEMAKAYTSLEKDDARRANLISAIGGKYRGNQLNALLENWDLYEKMLSDYANGAGSAFNEAMKSANNWEGSLNKLSNTWTSLVQNFTDTNSIITTINLITGLISTIDKLTESVGGIIPLISLIGIGFATWKIVIPMFTAMSVGVVNLAAGVTTATVAQQGLNAAFAAFQALNPVGQILLVVSAIASVISLVSGIKSFTQSLEEAQQAYSETKTELESINSELETTSKRINELNSKGSLTLIEKDELSNLQKSNAELERRKRLLEDKLKLEAQNLNNKIYSDYNKEYNYNFNRSAGLYSDYASSDSRTAFSGRGSTQQISEEEYYKRVAKRYEKLDKLGKERTKNQEKEYKELSEYLINTGEKFQDFADQIVVTDDASKKYKQTLRDLAEIADKALHPDLWKDDKLTELLDSKEFKNTKKELLELSKAGKLDDKTLSKYPALKTELDKLGVSAEDVVNVIKAIKEESQDITTPTSLNFGEIFTKYSESTKLLETAKKEIKDFGTFSENTYKSLIEKFPQLTNALDNFMLGFSDKANISKILQEQYDDDVKNYNKTLQEKLSYSTKYYDKLVDENANLIDKFSENYDVDLANCNTLAEAKYKVEVELVKKLAGVWADYYDTALQGFDLQQMSKDGKLLFDPRAGMSGLGGLDSMSEEQRKQAEELSKKSKEIRDMLNNAANLWGNFKFEDAKFLDAGKDKDKSSKDTWKEAFQAEYNYLKYLRESDQINAQQYYDKLDVLNQKYFANRTKYLEEYRQYDLELYKLDQELAEKRIKDWEHTLTLKINAQGEESTKGEQIRVYTQIQDELHRLANEGRKRGLAENSEYIQRLNNQWWDYEKKKFDITKQYQDKQKSLYEGYISTVEKIQDMTISMIKKEMELQRDFHKEKIDAIKDEFDLKRSLLDDKLDDYDYNKNLQEKVNAANKIQGNINLIKNDETQKGRLRQLEDELKKAMDDLNDFQYRHNIDVQKKIYDDQEKQLTDKHQTEIDAIEKQLDNEVYLREEADKRIKKSGYSLYYELINFANEYGIFSKREVDEVWKEYEKVLSNFNVSQNGIISTLDTLYDKLAGIKDLLSQMSNMSLGEFSSFQSSSVNDIISQMEANSKAWHTSNNKTGLSNSNLDKANQLKELGVDIERGSDGYWYYKGTKKRVYHTGGVVSKNDDRFKSIGDLKSDEVRAVLQDGELVFTKGGTPEFLKNISNITSVAEKLSKFNLPKFDMLEFAGKGMGDIKIENTYYITEADKDIDTKLQRFGKQVTQDTIKKIVDTCGISIGNMKNMVGSY